MHDDIDPEMHDAQMEVWIAACERAARNYRHPANLADPDYCLAADNRAKTMEAIASYLHDRKLLSR